MGSGPTIENAQSHQITYKGVTRMLPSINARIDDISRKIWECEKCYVINYYRTKNIPFRPEPFMPGIGNANYRMLYVAINPGWNRNNERNYEGILKKIYEGNDYERYKKEYEKAGEIIWPKKTVKNVTDKFPDNLSCMANAARRVFCPDIEDFTPDNYERHVFRTQLSYCSSNKLRERRINKVSMPETWKGIFEEGEVDTCLKSNYLKDIIECIKPEVILFLGQYSRDYFGAKSNEYLRELLGKDIESNIDIREEYQLKRGKSEIIGRVTSDKVQKILFLPHPCARINKIEELECKIEKLCKKLI